ncbi:hypothetical protein AMAG_06516 [Allomyces macrogynus ATCC 38327]|uniref:Uncharacterized protein n=1 Tax=Allomyces macrogynus (strain ATCC 38327) TaxID=578462 RepID=A0A0L0SGY8_ALLM3|nr:hypothetical protein AMAG_06516 [Allomyces macrogynus ATCC 38327]|eukprot:KNE61714.1 hypothetical protein AMAG_06516 [Allomyces macrogynus ATCC 38327]
MPTAVPPRPATVAAIANGPIKKPSAPDALDAKLRTPPSTHAHHIDYNGAPDRVRQRAADRVTFLLWQTTMYTLLWPIRMLLAVLGTLFTHRDPTEADVLRFIFESSMLMLVRKGMRDGEYLIAVTHCQVRMVHGACTQSLASFSARIVLPTTVDPRTGFLDVTAGSILEFTINGSRTTNPTQMLAALHTYCVASMHTKMHAVAGTIMRKIETDQITALYPSLEITRALHDVLLHSSWSPVAGPKSGWSNFNPVTRESLVAESLNWADFTHAGVFLFKDRLPFARFLWVARNATIKHTRPLGLDAVHAEYLFLHSVAHAVDHYSVHELTKGLRFPIWVGDENARNVADLVRSACFRYSFDAPTLNPFRSNLLREFPRDSVYGRIYREIRDVNREWADVATASIMY